jgi:hypothetical protein
MIALWLFAAAVHATGHQCRVPAAAYDTLNGSGVVGSVPAELPERKRQALERFAYCLCGPEGSVDWDPRPHRIGGFFMHPSCNKNGWDGHRYRRER